MPEPKPAKKATAKAAKRPAATGESANVFTPEERAAMRERAREQKAAERPRAKGASDESAVLEKIAAMAPPDRAMAEQLHALIRSSAPDLTPRLWYGMPAYAKNGHVVCFFQDARKFRTRYATLGFSDKAALDDGEMWPTAFALTSASAANETRIRELLTRALR